MPIGSAEPLVMPATNNAKAASSPNKTTVYSIRALFEGVLRF